MFAQLNKRRAKYLWERLRGLFLEFFIPDWEGSIALSRSDIRVHFTVQQIAC